MGIGIGIAIPPILVLIPIPIALPSGIPSPHPPQDPPSGLSWYWIVLTVSLTVLMMAVLFVVGMYCRLRCCSSEHSSTEGIDGPTPTPVETLRGTTLHDAARLSARAHWPTPPGTPQDSTRQRALSLSKVVWPSYCDTPEPTWESDSGSSSESSHRPSPPPTPGSKPLYPLSPLPYSDSDSDLQSDLGIADLDTALDEYISSVNPAPGEGPWYRSEAGGSPRAAPAPTQGPGPVPSGGALMEGEPFPPRLAAPPSEPSPVVPPSKPDPHQADECPVWRADPPPLVASTGGGGGSTSEAT